MYKVYDIDCSLHGLENANSPMPGRVLSASRQEEAFIIGSTIHILAFDRICLSPFPSLEQLMVIVFYLKTFDSMGGRRSPGLVLLRVCSSFGELFPSIEICLYLQTKSLLEISN